MPISVVLAPATSSLLSQGLANLLERHDISIIACGTDAAEAADLTCSKKADVLVISANLLMRAGIEILGRIKESSPHTKILVLSEFRGGRLVVPAMRLGALGYVQDNCTIEELVDAIRSVHSGEEVIARLPALEALHELAAYSAGQIASCEQLSPRETEVLSLVTEGLSNRTIARQLRISDRTVQSHLLNIFSKLGVTTRTQAAVAALQRGIVELDRHDASQPSPGV